MTAQEFTLEEATIDEVHAAFKSGALTAKALVTDYLERIEAVDKSGPALNSIINISPIALEEAEALDAEFKESGDGRAIWPAHFAGITREYCQIEKLANLEKLPRAHGFYVSCLPVKIKGGSAGWCRAVALIPPAV